MHAILRLWIRIEDRGDNNSEVLPSASHCVPKVSVLLRSHIKGRAVGQHYAERLDGVLCQAPLALETTMAAGKSSTDRTNTWTGTDG